MTRWACGAAAAQRWSGAGLLALVVVCTAGQAQTPAAPDTAASAPGTPVAKRSLLRSPDDGAIDLSAFIDQAYGFLPVIVPITEPAVGLGALGALAFIDKPERDAGAGFGRPNISVVGALATENGTRGWLLGDRRYWLDDRLQTLAGAIKTEVNLDYYGPPSSAFHNGTPRSYTLDVAAGGVQGKWRLGQSTNWVGLGYLVMDSQARFADGGLAPDAESSQRVAGLNMGLSHDSRDNFFTPTRGLYAEAAATVFDPSLGSDLAFTRYRFTGMQYLPVAPRWTLGLREIVSGNDGRTPFYLQPFVLMRGVPAMRYQGEKMAQLEAELRWQFMDRVSAVGFIGAGAVAEQFGQMTREQTVTAGGVGVRYEIARKYGVHMGLDVATSRDGTAVYVTFGSAWLRP